MANYENFHHHALYYDIAKERDVTAPIEFILEQYHCRNGREAQTVLEIACGPGYHAREFARKGLQVIGFDIRPEMIEIAQKHALDDNLEMAWFVGDMRDFTLDVPVDIAICMFDGLDALLTTEDLVAHLRAVARALTPGGLYMVENSHPRDCGLTDYRTFTYKGERNGLRVEVTYAKEPPPIDMVAGVAEVGVEIRVYRNGHVEVITDSAKERLFTPQELILLAERSDALDIVGWYGDFNASQPLDNSPGSSVMITLFQKPADG